MLFKRKEKKMSSVKAEEKPSVYEYPVDGAQIEGAALIQKVGLETFGEIADVIKRLGWKNTEHLLKTVKVELELDFLEASELKRSPTMAEDREPERETKPGLEYELEFVPDDDE